MLLSPSEYDEFFYKRLFLSSIEKGLSDAETGHVYTTDELRDEIKHRLLRLDEIQ